MVVGKIMRLSEKVTTLAGDALELAEGLEATIEYLGDGPTVGLNPSKALARLKSAMGKMVVAVEKLETALAAENAKSPTHRKGK